MGAPPSCVDFFLVDLKAHSFDLMILWLEAFFIRVLSSGCNALRLFVILQDGFIDLFKEGKLSYIYLMFYHCYFIIIRSTRKAAL